MRIAELYPVASVPDQLLPRCCCWAGWAGLTERESEMDSFFRPAAGAEHRRHLS